MSQENWEKYPAWGSCAGADCNNTGVRCRLFRCGVCCKIEHFLDGKPTHDMWTTEEIARLTPEYVITAPTLVGTATWEEVA